MKFSKFLKTGNFFKKRKVANVKIIIIQKKLNKIIRLIAAKLA